MSKERLLVAIITLHHPFFGHLRSRRKMLRSKTITNEFIQWPQKRWCTVIVVYMIFRFRIKQTNKQTKNFFFKCFFLYIIIMNLRPGPWSMRKITTDLLCGRLAIQSQQCREANTQAKGHYTRAPKHYTKAKGHLWMCREVLHLIYPFCKLYVVTYSFNIELCKIK